MADAGYKTLQEQIRSPAPIRAIATLPAFCSHSFGSLALPGPQTTMSSLERVPALRTLLPAASTTTVEHADQTAAVAAPLAVVAAPPVPLEPALDNKLKRMREAARERRKDPGKPCYCLNLKVAFSKSVLFV